MVRFLHTADWQLGMGFEGLSDGPGSWLFEQRFDTVERIARLAAERRCDFVVVAGDFFDAPTVPPAVIGQTCEVLGAFEMPVFVLPGNHDFGGGPGAVWARSEWRADAPDHVHLLNEMQCIEAPAGATLLPAPLHRRHVQGDPMAWITREVLGALDHRTIRIAVAHGSVTTFGQEAGDLRNILDVTRVEDAGVDYIALGDWHGLRQVSDRTWYSGAPEPTNYRDNDPGHVLVVDIAATGANPEVESVAVARTRWLEHEVRLATVSDIDALENLLNGLSSPRDTLVKLRLSGALPQDAHGRLARLLEGTERRLRHLRIVGPGVRCHLDENGLKALHLEGWVREAVDELTHAAQEGDDEAARAVELMLGLVRAGEAPVC